MPMVSLTFQGLYNSFRDNPYEAAGLAAASGVGILAMGYLASKTVPPLAKKVSAYFQQKNPPFPISDLSPPSEFAKINLLLGNREKIQTPKNIYHFFHRSFASKDKDRLAKALKIWIKMIPILNENEQTPDSPDYDPSIEICKNIEQIEFKNPFVDSRNPEEFYMGVLSHFLRKHLYQLPSEHKYEDLEILKLLAELIDGKLFQCKPEDLQERLGKCLKTDHETLSGYLNFANSDAEKMLRAYFKPLAACLLLITEHTDEAIEVLLKCENSPLPTSFLCFFLGVLDIKGEKQKADRLFQHIYQLPFQDLAESLSEERFSSYFLQKTQELNLDTQWDNLEIEHSLSLIMDKLGGKPVLVELVEKWLKPKDLTKHKMRVQRFALHKTVILQLLFNLPDSFWKNPICFYSIQKMIVSTPGIDPKTIATVQLGALWAISEPEQRDVVLKMIRDEIEPLSTANDEGSSKCVEYEMTSIALN